MMMGDPRPASTAKSREIIAPPSCWRLAIIERTGGRAAPRVVMAVNEAGCDRTALMKDRDSEQRPDLCGDRRLDGPRPDRGGVEIPGADQRRRDQRPEEEPARPAGATACRRGSVRACLRRGRAGQITPLPHRQFLLRRTPSSADPARRDELRFYQEPIPRAAATRLRPRGLSRSRPGWRRPGRSPLSSCVDLPDSARASRRQ